MLGRWKMFKNFLKNTKGNVAMIAALTIIPVLAILGGGVDVIRATTTAAEVRSAVDSAVLAAANLDNSQDPETVAREYIAVNLRRPDELLNNLVVNVTVEDSINSRKVEATLTADIDTYFLGLVGMKTLPVRADATAYQALQKLEVALILDISGSMGGSRLRTMKDSATEFVNILLQGDNDETTSISIVPYSTQVNVGGDVWNEFVVSTSRARYNPNESRYNIGSSVRYRLFRFPDERHCLEFENDDFTTDLLPSNDRSSVPSAGSNASLSCPHPDNASLFGENRLDELEGKIDDLSATGNTAIHLGAIWGLRSLSPAYRGVLSGQFDDRPADFDADDTLKFMVMMTDGNPTYQIRPEDPREGIRYNSDIQNVQSTGWINNYLDSNGNVAADLSDDYQIPQLLRTCKLAADNQVIVFTIGFAISDGSEADRLLKACASDGSKYFRVDEADLRDTFEKIANEISKLRLTD